MFKVSQVGKKGDLHTQSLLQYISNIEKHRKHAQHIVAQVRPCRAYFNSPPTESFLGEDFCIPLVSAGKEHFILPEMNHSSSD